MIAADLGVLLAVPAWALFWVARAVRNLHIFQLEEYQSRRFLRWWRAEAARSIGAPTWLGMLALLALAALPAFGLPELFGIFAGVGWAVLFGVRFFRRSRVPAKKPLVWTARAKRLFGLTAVVVAGVAAAGLTASAAPLRAAVALGAMGLLTVLDGPVLALANLLAQPVEAAVRRFYLWQARRKLRAVGPYVIGVTGSYGKTSTKEIIAALLSAKAETLKPPGSYNTLMGLCLTINRWLAPHHRFFVAEMGAYGRGDIKALCDLVAPSAGVLTAIGPEHLERFGTIEAIEQTKYELIEALPPDGIAFFNVDDERVRRLADATRHVRVVRYGLQPEGRPDVTAAQIQTSPRGIEIEVVRGDERFHVRCGLLGRHNALNLLAGIAVARELGVAPEAIVRAAAGITAPEHRLQLIPTPGGPTIIDDAYNANPVGVRAALEVLAEMPGGKKILVTPGMVELGPVEEEENRRFGEAAAAVCDLVILVGPRRTAPIQAGLRAAGFPEERLFVVRSLAEATDLLRLRAAPADIVLFCNDLPDQYNE
ncbi:MAG: UDP-N-acetylmuramoyl-tripeptide--D-alanyl-D-alanine ligase [Chloroflexota bacterium]|nr:UDP-N-acetylmuramoyl-tripeptide--D-alanyl-D-alanine ligase [Dehalococcoidia bacterium]MDW8252896.1 UDP-N-acetylmuramoyl-tripeptide--D-alanyl-D-alanine ligase [Chloroflexota bacterium]